jgi:hypothetical protein
MKVRPLCPELFQVELHTDQRDKRDEASDRCS